jgi:glutamyl-tRNA reductase
MSQIVATADSPHRRDAADIIRRLGGRTDAALRRELDRFFAARPGLSHADRAAIVRAMSRFRNQLLHHPRITLRTAVADPAGAHTWLDAIRQLFGLAEDPRSKQAAPRAPEHRAPIESAGSSTS